LGTASYTIYQKDGTTSTGVSQSGISATSNIFNITPVSVPSLLGHSYIIAITVVVNSVSKTWYKPITLSAGSDNSSVLSAIGGVKNLILGL
jgi:hypothetical protein